MAWRGEPCARGEIDAVAIAQQVKARGREATVVASKKSSVPVRSGRGRNWVVQAAMLKTKEGAGLGVGRRAPRLSSTWGGERVSMEERWVMAAMEISNKFMREGKPRDQPQHDNNQDRLHILYTPFIAFSCPPFP